MSVLTVNFSPVKNVLDSERITMEPEKRPAVPI